MKRAIALVTESTRRDGTRQGFAAPRPVGAPLTEPAPPPKKDRLRGRCPSESSPGSRAPNPDSSHSNWTILWGQVSTNKVYGDRPNDLPLRELASRHDYADGRDGIDETMSIDACLHSLFGASKVAADVMCQEFGRYFDMPVGVFRAGCLTGPQHAAVELHGYLAYIVHCAATGRPYTIYGYQGKQVRDQIHCRDVASLFLAFHNKPRAGEVYNLGGGRTNSLSILETIDTLGQIGLRLDHRYQAENRVGDHICYITDLTKVRAHFPEWTPQYSIERIVDELVAGQAATRRGRATMTASLHAARETPAETAAR